MLKRIIINNFKGLRHADIEFEGGINILIGDNETGKSTVLEAINLALTGQLNRRSAAYELHPFLFNKAAADEYVTALQRGEHVEPPKITIEAYLDTAVGALWKGTNNSRGENCPGTKIKIHLDDQFADEYECLLRQPDRISTIPVDYYRVTWESFAETEPLSFRKTPMRAILIDPGALSNTFAVNKYVVDIARDFLTPAQQADLSVVYRDLKQVFHTDENVQAINERLEAETGEVSDRALSVALDMTARANWESSVLPHLDGLPMTQVGKGEQNSLKIKLAIKAASEHPVLLVEEPENHLSHANLSRLLSFVSGKLDNRQAIITTHNSLVLNKLGPDAAMLFDGSSALRLRDLPKDTRDYFMKLPGHDTLRMVLASRTILVEGPSDELVVQKAYFQIHRKMPLEDGIEVITVNSLAFKRFLDIAKILTLRVTVVTDNDGDVEALRSKYNGYWDIEGIQICFSDNEALPTLEPHLLERNDRKTICAALEKDFADDEALKRHMVSNKADVALKIFETQVHIEMPEYILDAVA